MPSGSSSTATAPISAACRSATPASTTAGSALATARCSTPRDASGRAPPRSTCRSRPTPSSPTRRSRSARAARPRPDRADELHSKAPQMSDHQHATTYVPKSAFAKWFESRLPIAGLIHSSFVAFPVPRNLNYFWTFGAVLFFMLVLQIVTGVILAIHYQPSATAAFDSLEHIMRDVNYGWLLRYLHANGASMFFVAVYIHIFRNLYYGSYKAPREILYILGVIIYGLMMATAFMGYTLPWGQMSFWGVTVITNLFSALDTIINGLGTAVVEWLWGGYSVSGVTLNRFYSLHYLLPFVLTGIVGLHLWALHTAGQNNPTGLDLKEPSDSVPMHPYATSKDAVGLFAFIIL